MKKSIILLTFFILTACGSIFTNRTLKKIGVLDTKSELRIIKNKKKKIIFLLMHHVGNKDFFDDVAHKIDSLQKLDYTVFYESTRDDKETDSLIKETNGLKLRKLMGFFPGKYLDTAKNVIAGKIKYKEKHKLIEQPNYNKLNVDSLTSIKADVSLSELISEFEKKHTEIKLDSCDFKFSLEDKNYKCKKANKSLQKIFNKDYIKDYRNKYLAKKIINSKKNKILVIYGNAHYYGLSMELYLLGNIRGNQDNRYEI